MSKCIDKEEGRVMEELKPCPFCGVMPHIYWEAWKDISPDAGVWKLEANHKDSCYITHINGTNISGRSSARRLSQLVEWWNHREELFGNSEQLESGHEKDHVADPGKMVGDLISRQAAKNKKVYSEERHEYVVPVAELDWLPSAQPERKQGKWIERNPQNSDTCRLIECDQCGFSHIVGFNVPYEHWIENRNFCERCGADMREVVKND